LYEAGGRLTELRGAALDPREPAHGGRFAESMRCVLISLLGRFEPPKPCGARPESVALPCAFQDRFELPGRAELFIVDPERVPNCPAFGGRLAEIWDCRLALIPFGALLEDIERAAVEEGARPAENAPEFMVRAGECAAAAAGVLRAITLRFCTRAEGVAMRPFRFAAPNELVREGAA
jgi:hypothetical protein